MMPATAQGQIMVRPGPVSTQQVLGFSEKFMGRAPMTVDPESVILSISSPEVIREILQIANWMREIEVANPILNRTRSILIQFQNRVAKKFKGIGAITDTMRLGEKIPHGNLILPPSRGRKFEHDNFEPDLDDKLNLSVLDPGTDHEGSMPYTRAISEFENNRRLASHNLAFDGVMAGAYLDSTTKEKYLDSDGNQLGFVVLESGLDYGILGRVIDFCVKDQTGKDVFCGNESVFSKGQNLKYYVRTYMSIIKKAAEVRMASIVEAEITGHNPHLGNLLSDGAAKKILISDTDQCESIEDSSPEVRAAKLIRDIANHVFRIAYDVSARSFSSEFLNLMEKESNLNPFVSILNGYFEGRENRDRIYAPSAMIQKVAGGLKTDYADFLRKNLNELTIVRTAWKKRHQAGDMQAYRQFFPAWIAIHMEFFPKCTQAVYDLVSKSTRLAELGFTPVAMAENEVFTLHSRQLQPHITAKKAQVLRNFTD